MFYICKRLMAFFYYNVAASVAAKLATKDVMEIARGLYQPEARLKGYYERRAVPVLKKRQSPGGDPQEFLPTWREELNALSIAARQRQAAHPRPARLAARILTPKGQTNHYLAKCNTLE
jgi:hypothetical protein